MTSGSALYTGAVVHERLRPRAHRLRYRVFSLLLDLDELPALHRRLKLFSVGRPNVLSLRESDHGDGQPGTLRERVDAWLRTAGLPPAGRVRLLTMPRLFGYAFNPLSVFFCDGPDGRLQAIVHEVTSTFGERHHYVLPVDAAQAAAAAREGRAIEQRCGKRMHVSPFIGMEMAYAFRIVPPGGGRLCIGVDVHDEQGLLLHASHAARARPLTDAQLAKALLTHPLLTLKVIAAIHWEALRLWLRGVPLQPRPPRASHPVTTVPPTTPP